VRTDKNFKFPQKYKLLVRLTKGSDELRSLWKKSFIEATLAEEDYRKAKISKEKRD
jgi:hypothetical protein